MLNAFNAEKAKFSQTTRCINQYQVLPSDPQGYSQIHILRVFC